jgi:hypothetical protein
MRSRLSRLHRRQDWPKDRQPDEEKESQHTDREKETFFPKHLQCLHLLPLLFAPPAQSIGEKNILLLRFW